MLNEFIVILIFHSMVEKSCNRSKEWNILNAGKLLYMPVNCHIGAQYPSQMLKEHIVFLLSI